MIRCPNCSSTAQLKVIDHDTYIWRNGGSVYITYRCGCGRGFVIRVPFDIAKGEMYDEEI